MTSYSKVRIYDLAKELKMESKRIMEEVRREGVDVSVPSNTISKELAEKIRNKYFPKKEPTVQRAVRVVKKAKHAEDDAAHAPEPSEAPVPEVYAEPHAESPSTGTSPGGADTPPSCVCTGCSTRAAGASGFLTSRATAGFAAPP